MNVPARTPAQMPAQMPAMTPAETALGARLPNRRMEAWRWTDLSRLIDKAYPPHQGVAVEAADVHRLMASSPFAQLGFARVVFVNGAFDAARSTLPNGARVTSKNADAESADAIATLAARFAEDGLHLELEGEQDRPLECLYITTAGAPRLVATTSTLTLKPGARDAVSALIEQRMEGLSLGT